MSGFELFKLLQAVLFEHDLEEAGCFEKVVGEDQVNEMEASNKKCLYQVVSSVPKPMLNRSRKRGQVNSCAQII